MEKKPSIKSLPERFLHACLMFLGAVIALNIAVMCLQPLLPWLVGGVALVTTAWLVVALVRWISSRRQ
jgi:hypothetical protein